MNITPETKPINELFPIEGDMIHHIPIYQRGYSWTNQNIEDLIKDIQDEEKGYYLGNLLVTKHIDGNEKEFDIVDGQQRLTTIALIFLAIYEKLNSFDGLPKAETEKIGEIKGYIRKKLRSQNGSPRLQLLNRDDKVFRNYLEVLADKEKGKFGNRAFAKRYKYIQEYLDDNYKNLDKLVEFYDKVNAVEVLRITTTDVADAYSVFTSLNAKGLPLTLIDLLKTEYLGRAVSALQDNDKALEKWEKLISIFTDSSEEPNSIAITQFLLNNYDAFIGKKQSSLTKKNALKEYTEVFEDKGHRYIEELTENAEIFAHILPTIDTPNLVRFDGQIMKKLEILQKLDASQAYPLLLQLLKKCYHQEIAIDEVIKTLEFIIKFYVRRNIVLKPKASNIRAKIIEIVRFLNENDNWGQVHSETARFLNQIATTDADFSTALEGSVYDIAASTVRFILIDLEREYGQYFNKQRPDNLDDMDQKKSGRKLPVWTLEHILPETEGELIDGWAEMISPDNIDLAKSIQQINMHKIGNLTLTGYNSELGNRGFVYKRDYKKGNDYVGLRTGLYINSSIPNPELLEKIEDKISWTIEDINRRTEWFKKQILNRYEL